jgi:5-methylcytosine-specific restriction endonuclease McrA
MNRHYAGVAERAGHRCEYCHAPEAIFNLPFEVEHIVPTSRDGPDDESNQALACRACNLYKSDQQSGIDQTTREVVRLFHQRSAATTARRSVGGRINRSDPNGGS